MSAPSSSPFHYYFFVVVVGNFLSSCPYAWISYLIAELFRRLNANHTCLYRFFVKKSLEKFLKSNGQSIFQYLLVIPYYHNQQQTTGISKQRKNEDGEDEDGLILTEKSIDVLFSLASSSVFLPLYRFFDIAFFWFSFLI
jgi:hypothetical protein